jgi:hypothetical protein
VEYVLVAAVILALVAFVAAPLRRPRDADAAAAHGAQARVAELEVRKEAKYREIRDAQLDHAAGKLSEGDFKALDAELRREAMTILAELDKAEAELGRVATLPR